MTLTQVYGELEPTVGTGIRGNPVPQNHPKQTEFHLHVHHDYRNWESPKAFLVFCTSSTMRSLGQEVMWGPIPLLKAKQVNSMCPQTSFDLMTKVCLSDSLYVHLDQRALRAWLWSQGQNTGQEVPVTDRLSGPRVMTSSKIPSVPLGNYHKKSRRVF